jgi:hypothetical protein
MAWKKPDSSKQPVRFSQWSVRQGRVTVEIDSTTVNVTTTGLSGRNHWSEPLSSFTGVFRRGILKNYGEGGFLETYYVELLHPVPGKTVSLYSSSELADAHKKWKEVARSLNLPAVEDTPIGRITRQPDDLDKSIRALLAKSKIPGFLEDVTRPPPRVLVTRNGDTVHIVTRPRQVRGLVASLFLFGLGGILYNQEFATYEIRLAFSVCLGLIGLLILVMVFTYMDIVVTPSTFTYSTATPIGNFGRKSVLFDELHSVVWAGQRIFVGQQSGFLSLASNSAKIRIPMNLEHADWIGRFVMTAAAGKLPG